MLNANLPAVESQCRNVSSLTHLCVRGHSVFNAQPPHFLNNCPPVYSATCTETERSASAVPPKSGHGHTQLVGTLRKGTTCRIQDNSVKLKPELEGASCPSKKTDRAAVKTEGLRTVTGSNTPVTCRTCLKGSLKVPTVTESAVTSGRAQSVLPPLLSDGQRSVLADGHHVHFDERVIAHQAAPTTNSFESKLHVRDEKSHKDEAHSQRSNKFLSSFSPVNMASLRHIFLSSNNEVNGRYFAEILQIIKILWAQNSVVARKITLKGFVGPWPCELLMLSTILLSFMLYQSLMRLKVVIKELEASKYQTAEIRLVLYGFSPNEWHDLAKWISDFNLVSDHIRWLIEIPRLYDLYRSHDLVSSFQQFLLNIFEPLFAVTVSPGADPALHTFLLSVCGLDIFDDEHLVDSRLLDDKDPTPSDWTSLTNPPFGYYAFYVFANLVSLNHLRRLKGYNTFTLRPYCADSGQAEHLVTSFLTSESITHGAVLSKVVVKSPVLLYLFYLAQMGITTSVVDLQTVSSDVHMSFSVATVSDPNKLRKNREPLSLYHNLGLLVSLSTRQPIHTHITREPLMEEYAVASQVLNLSAMDLSELACNSIHMSGFPRSFKERWLSTNYEHGGPIGPSGNKIGKRTSVSNNIRLAFRIETFLEELAMHVHTLKVGITDADRKA